MGEMPSIWHASFDRAKCEPPACPLWERGQVEYMKIQKLFFLLSVALLFTGCGGKEDIRTGETGLETEVVEEGAGTEEAVRETETAGTEEAGETGLPEKETGTETGTIPETAVFSVTEELPV